MKKNQKSKINILFILILFLFVSVPDSIFAYGGDGPASAADSDSYIDSPTQPEKKSDAIKTYTKEELEKFFSGLPDGVRQLVIGKQEGKSRTPAQLNRIRNIFLDADRFKHESEEAMWQAYEEVAVVLDNAGQTAELALAFTTGGTSTFVTQTLFGATRAGVNEYSKGKGVGDILQAVAVAVSVDSIMNNVGKLSKLGNRANQLVDGVYRATKLKKGAQTAKLLAKLGVKAGILKKGEMLTKDAIGAILNSMVTTARNAQPTRTSRPTNVYTNQAGIW